MSRRVTTRFEEALFKLIVEKAANEKKTISETIAELAAASILSNENDEIGLLAKSIAELSSSLSSVQKEFQIHKETSQREFEMVLHTLILVNETSKRIFSKSEHEEAWNKCERIRNEYVKNDRISL